MSATGGTKEGQAQRTHVADASTAVLARLEGVSERDNDSRTRRANGMAEADATAESVDLLRVKIQELVVGDCDGRKGLIDLPEGDV